MNENKKPSSIPEGLSSIADDEAITEIDFNDFLEETAGSAPLFEGFHEDIEKTEKSLENELRSLYDDIMSSGPETIVPKPLSMLTASEAEPAKVALSVPEEGEAESLEDLWMNPDDYFDDDIPVVSLDGDADANTAKSEKPVAAPAEIEPVDSAKDDIFSMIDSLKSETDSETGFDDILSEIEANREIAPVDSELSAAAQLIASLPKTEAFEEEEAEEEIEELDFDEEDFAWDEPVAPEATEIPEIPEIPEISEADEVAAEADEGDFIDTSSAEFERELAELLGDAPPAAEEKAEDPAPAGGFVINVPDDGNDYEKAASMPEKLYESAPMSSASLSDDPDLIDGPEDEYEPKKSKKKKNRKAKAKKEPAPAGAGEVIRKIVLSISIITIIVSCGILVNTYFIEPYRFKSDAKELADQMSEGINNHSDSSVNDIQTGNSDVDYPDGMLAKYAQLYAANNDLAGWISIPGFEINLPIAQGNDNNFYLKKDIYGKYTRYGVPFFDYRMTDLVNLHRNTVVYGHNMRHDDLIFGMLENYRDIEGGFDQAPVIECNTIYGDHTWFVYAVFLTNAEEEDDNGYVFPYNFIDVGDAKFASYIEDIDKRKFYTTGVDIAPTDKILTLSTCCYDFDNARLVVVAREKREGESINVDTSKAYYNKNPKYPQAWYDANGKENTYAEDSRW